MRGLPPPLGSSAAVTRKAGTRGSAGVTAAGASSTPRARRGCRPSDWEACTLCWGDGLPERGLGQDDPSSGGGKGRDTQTSTAGWVWRAARSWGLWAGSDRQELGVAWVGRQAWCSCPEAGPQAQLSSLKPQFFPSREKQMAPLILWHFQASLRYYMQDPSANCSTTPRRHSPPAGSEIGRAHV